MVAHLEECPEAKVVVNFAPVLLEQLDDYAEQIQSWLANGKAMRDDMLNLLAGAVAVPEDLAGRRKIVEDCQRCFAPNIIDPYPKFRQLVNIANNYMGVHEEAQQMMQYLGDNFFRDLLMWYHLAWTGESLRRQDPRVRGLMDQGSNFDFHDQQLMLRIMHDAISGIIPRYRKLLHSGQIEISTTPYGHPIVPLLLDFSSMRDALPHAPAPHNQSYPGGNARARWHMEKGFEVYQKYFNQRPAGVWLSEGAVSTEALAMLDEYAIKWTATGQGVWGNSCTASSLDATCGRGCHKAYYHPVQLEGQDCALFFRDDGLSDLIGFQYKSWAAHDAVNDFIHHLQNIRGYLGDKVKENVVSVILDGENAWEYYPQNAYAFLQKLYNKLVAHPDIELTTFSDALTDGAKATNLPVLRAGSWVYGSFSTWIGEKDKNLGWDLLVDAKQVYDEVIASGRLTNQQELAATQQLAVCEGSDWFWWFGDYNPAGSVRDFELLYRRHLQKLYELLGEKVPQNLHTSISHGGGNMENSGTMRRN